MDLKQFLQILRRRWRSVVALPVLALLVAGGITYFMDAEYESKSRVWLTVDTREAADAYTAAFIVQQRAASYASAAKSSGLAEEVIGRLDLEDLTPEELADRISADVEEGTTFIEITVRDGNARTAQTINDVVTTTFIDYVTELETPSGAGGASQIDPKVTDAPTYNPDKVSPRTVLNLVVGGIIGLLLGVALAIARDLLDRTIHTVDDVAKFTEAPVLASIGYDPAMKKSPLISDLGGFAARTEAFRVLRTNLQFIDLDNHPKVLVVTSATPTEGKTMTATNLAIALAQTGRKTLVVDADLRRPRVASTLGLDPAVGLTTALIGKAEISDAIQVHEPSGLHVLASGAKPPNPTEILQARVTKDVIARLRQSYDMVVIDAPPLLPVADAAVLASIADGTLLVARHNKTTTDQASDAVSRLQQVGARLLGVVVNMVSKRAVGSYYYYYYEETSPVGAKARVNGDGGGSREKLTARRGGKDRRKQ
ncbi:polysaccharide biosynthesis tyrosine autokinase [Nocardioides sp. TF02-7]|uniref:polysaccharide biosynthesis tyrosine autokinase n=1 Tax=Nocardioides sp. TF02-7 TaxID=2917724 RepID=UPI001F06381F|nr:polysaccharide biosynthesis tyrosine autokinase [Nocardioides sp. TF02-7]UMG91135.1 polysaccharide biosynthesis tyrosine autokinase [Nocardioides sp. TF02-7]